MTKPAVRFTGAQFKIFNFFMKWSSFFYCGMRQHEKDTGTTKQEITRPGSSCRKKSLLLFQEISKAMSAVLLVKFLLIHSCSKWPLLSKAVREIRPIQFYFEPTYMHFHAIIHFDFEPVKQHPYYVVLDTGSPHTFVAGPPFTRQKPWKTGCKETYGSIKEQARFDSYREISPRIFQFLRIAFDVGLRTDVEDPGEISVEGVVFLDGVLGLSDKPEESKETGSPTTAVRRPTTTPGVNGAAARFTTRRRGGLMKFARMATKAPVVVAAGKSAASSSSEVEITFGSSFRKFVTESKRSGGYGKNLTPKIAFW